MKPDLYTEITGKIVTMLENGTAPWRKPWTEGGMGSLPLRSNGAAYQGINVLILWSAAATRGFSSPYWMTFNQAKDIGASVKKGAKSEIVVYVGAFEKENEATGEAERVPFLKSYRVFNVEEIDGLAPHYYPAKPQPMDWQHDNRAEDFFAATGATIRHGGDRAYYSPSTDHVQMPDRAAFAQPDAYYSVLAHECAHWTGAKARLDRTFGKRFGDDAYAMEELVAEMSAAFTAARLGICPEPKPETASYLAGWLRVLKDDRRAIFTAASAAEKATAFLFRNALAPVALVEPAAPVARQAAFSFAAE